MNIQIFEYQFISTNKKNQINKKRIDSHIYIFVYIYSMLIFVSSQRFLSVETTRISLVYFCHRNMLPPPPSALRSPSQPFAALQG